MNNDGSKDTKLGGTQCKNSPFDEYAKVETGRDGAVTVNWEYNPEDDSTVTKSMTYEWSVAKIAFVEESYAIGDTVQFKFKDKDLGDIGKDSKVFVNPLFDEGAEIKPVAETFGNVKNYLGGQVGDLGDKVSVLPNAETSIGSLKQAIPKPSIIEDGIADTTKTVTDVAKSAVSDQLVPSYFSV